MSGPTAEAYGFKAKYMNRLTPISPIDIISTISGPTLIPGVSSSKNRSKPALAAGIGASRLRLFSRADDKCWSHCLGRVE